MSVSAGCSIIHPHRGGKGSKKQRRIQKSRFPTRLKKLQGKKCLKTYCVCTCKFRMTKNFYQNSPINIWCLHCLSWWRIVCLIDLRAHLFQKVLVKLLLYNLGGNFSPLVLRWHTSAHSFSGNIFLIKSCRDTVTDMGLVPAIALTRRYLFKSSGEFLNIVDPGPMEPVSLGVVSGRHCFIKLLQGIIMYIQVWNHQTSERSDSEP